MIKVSIFTDGACSGNPGPGGWGALLVAKQDEKIISKKEICGGAKLTTNNRMELTAAIKGLKELTKPSKVTVVTDSKYLKDGMTKWLDQWFANGWQTTAKKDIKNIDLWKEIHSVSKLHIVSWDWVKGHDNHEENERADFLARLGMKKFKH
tara:strand:- start:353 stop:805 length:453 start_codon:yes stop_codon:yes gene_type:complete